MTVLGYRGFGDRCRRQPRCQQGKYSLSFRWCCEWIEPRCKVQQRPCSLGAQDKPQTRAWTSFQNRLKGFQEEARQILSRYHHRKSGRQGTLVSSNSYLARQFSTSYPENLAMMQGEPPATRRTRSRTFSKSSFPIV